MIPQLALVDLARRREDARGDPVLIDVREPQEFAYCRIDPAIKRY